MAVRRTYYRDRWNEKKVWEVVKLVGGYYLRQYISGQQVGRGMKTWVSCQRLHSNKRKGVCRE